MFKKCLTGLVVLVAVLGVQWKMAQPAHAGATGGNCAPYQSYSYYYNNYCIYHEPAPMAQGSFLYINYYLDSTITAYSSLTNDANTAAMNWSYTTHAKYTRVTSPCSGSNCVTVSGSYSSQYYFYNTDTCSHGYWGYGDSGSKQVILNEYLFSQGCSNSGWTGLIGHEFGHAMGLDHNTYMYNGDSNCNGATYSMIMVGYCGVKVTQPQDSDISALNAIYSNDPNNCPTALSNWSCDNEDYIQEGCNAYPQSNKATDANIAVTLYYSTNCESNWTWAKVSNSNVIITKIDIERASGTDGPAFTLTDYPNSASWYTNNLYSPNNSARSCVWYKNTATGATGSLCTTWL